MDHQSVMESIFARLDAGNIHPKRREGARLLVEGNLKAGRFDPNDESEVQLVVTMLIQGYSIPDLKTIKQRLSTLDLDQATRDRWCLELAQAAGTGWFCPSIDDEMSKAVEALQVGRKVPSFPRCG